jgi:hypothetical protein
MMCGLESGFSLSHGGSSGRWIATESVPSCEVWYSHKVSDFGLLQSDWGEFMAMGVNKAAHVDQRAFRRRGSCEMIAVFTTPGGRCPSLIRCRTSKYPGLLPELF